MKFSTRTRYGIRFLIYLGTQDRARFVQLGEVSEAEGVSQKYLEQIIRLLKPSGMIDSARGVTGGYRLAVDPVQVSLEEIFEYLEGNLAPINCLKEDEPCDRKDVCSTLAMWEGLEKVMRDYLKNISLEDLIKEAKAINCMMMKE